MCCVALGRVALGRVALGRAVSRRVASRRAVSRRAVSRRVKSCRIVSHHIVSHCVGALGAHHHSKRPDGEVYNVFESLKDVHRRSQSMLGALKDKEAEDKNHHDRAT